MEVTHLWSVYLVMTAKWLVSPVWRPVIKGILGVAYLRLIWSPLVGMRHFGFVAISLRSSERLLLERSKVGPILKLALGSVGRGLRDRFEGLHRPSPGTDSGGVGSIPNRYRRSIKWERRGLAIQIGPCIARDWIVLGIAFRKARRDPPYLLVL